MRRGRAQLRRGHLTLGPSNRLQLEAGKMWKEEGGEEGRAGRILLIPQS